MYINFCITTNCTLYDSCKNTSRHKGILDSFNLQVTRHMFDFETWVTVVVLSFSEHAYIYIRQYSTIHLRAWLLTCKTCVPRVYIPRVFPGYFTAAATLDLGGCGMQFPCGFFEVLNLVICVFWTIITRL